MSGLVTVMSSGISPLIPGANSVHPVVRSRAAVPDAATLTRVPEDGRGARRLPVIRKAGRTGNNEAPADGLRAGGGTPRAHDLPRALLSARPDAGTRWVLATRS